MSLELLERAQNGDASAREKMVLDNSRLVWSVVRRFTGRGVDSDDLFQLGCMGLLKAIDGFNLEYGTMFSTYAVPKIAGEIRRYLRDEGSVKVSRTLKEQAAQIKTARNKLLQTLGREPLLSELSQETGLTPEEIATAETAVLPADSLQRSASEDGCELEQLLPGEEIEEQIIEAVSLRDAMQCLDPRQRAVIDMRYFHGMTQDRVARVLGVSQVQISRIEKKALLRLRAELASN